MGSLRGCGLTLYGRGTRLIQSMLLWYRLAELSLCTPGLNEAIYRTVHCGLKCPTRLQWPIKDKGVPHHSGGWADLELFRDTVAEETTSKS